MPTSFNNAQITTNIILPSLATLTTVLRFWSRAIKKQRLGWDDYTVLISLILTIGICITGVYAGFSFHEIDLMSGKNVRVNRENSQILFYDVILGHIIYGLIKISVALFYKRIFFVSKWFLINANVYMIAVVCWVISATFGHLYAYPNGPTEWWVPFSRRQHFVMDWPSFIIVMSVADLALDIIVLSMPWPIIKQLQLGTRKKAYVSLFFLLGTFCVVASAVRLYYVVRLTDNLAFIFSPPIVRVRKLTDLWCHIEACASIIAACLPTLGPVFKAAHTPMSLLESLRSIFSIKSQSSSNVQDKDASPAVSTRLGRSIEETKEVQTDFDVSYWEKGRSGIQAESSYA